jgi:Fic family protein
MDDIKMDYETLLKKRDFISKNKSRLKAEILQNYEDCFAIDYTYDSTTIEGNTLTQQEVALVLADNVSIGGKDMREIYEVVNHNKAYIFLKNAIAQKKPLDENMVKDIHMILLENIIQGGFYRSQQVYIKGARHIPPEPGLMFAQVKEFFEILKTKQCDNPIELSAWTHAEFVKIHPFIDGNGRVSRLLMNYQLMKNKFLPITIPTSSRLEYFESLDKYHISGCLTDFIEMIARLENARLDIYCRAIKEI